MVIFFVTHPSCEPFYVAYDIAGNTFTATQINLKERDFVGITSDSALIKNDLQLSQMFIGNNLANQAGLVGI